MTSACGCTAVIPDAVEFSGTHALLVWFYVIWWSSCTTLDGLKKDSWNLSINEHFDPNPASSQNGCSQPWSHASHLYMVACSATADCAAFPDPEHLDQDHHPDGHRPNKWKSSALSFVGPVSVWVLNVHSAACHTLYTNPILFPAGVQSFNCTKDCLCVWWRQK